MAKRLALIGFMLVITLCVSIFSVSAVDITLSLNTDSGNTEWFITGESSLVMNGFELSRFGVTTPATLRSMSISVAQAVAGVNVEAVVYQDANGGSPVDATLLARQSVSITSSGTFTVTFSTPPTITQPVIWVGFYLPVNFRFYGDNQGSSVLTYWAWTPGTTFDVASLANASVLGPANGTAPVNINMGGIARITAVVSTGTTITTTPGATVAVTTVPPTAGPTPTNNFSYAAVMFTYTRCPNLLRDLSDVHISMNGRFGLECQPSTSADRFGTVPAGYVQRGGIYAITIYVSGIPWNVALPAAVTHCIVPAPEDVNRGIVGLAWNLARDWTLLPTQVYNGTLCAEVIRPGFLTYFVPAS